MKKVLIADSIHRLLEQEMTFLNRRDTTVLVASTNDQILHVHRAERTDLIITRLDMPGMPSEELARIIRQNADLRAVSIIMTCANTSEAINGSSRCKPNAVLLEPVHPVLLAAKAQQLLFIAARETLRVLLTVKIKGQTGDSPFYCRSRNVSGSGMLIETDKRLAEGTRLSCEFYLPNAKKVLTSGKIIRIIEQTSGDEDYRYGLMFTDISAECRQMLLDYVEDVGLHSAVE